MIDQPRRRIAEIATNLGLEQINAAYLVFWEMHKMYVPGKVGEENMKGMSWFDMDLKNVQFEMKYNKKKKNAM